MKYVYLVLMIVMLYACNGKTQNDKYNANSLSQEPPFIVKPAEKYIKIPDSIRPVEFKNGMLVIAYFVNSVGDVEGVNLHILRLLDKDNNRLIWYYNDSFKPIDENDYPDKVKPYLDWVFKYSKTRSIVKKENVEVNNKWMVTIVLRIK